MKEVVYKVGDWLKDKQNGHLYEITEVRAGVWVDFCKLIRRYPRSTGEPYLESANNIKEFADIVPMARLLYSNKVTTNNGALNETDEK